MNDNGFDLLIKIDNCCNKIQCLFLLFFFEYFILSLNFGRKFWTENVGKSGFFMSGHKDFYEWSIFVLSKSTVKERDEIKSC